MVLNDPLLKDFSGSVNLSEAVQRAATLGGCRLLEAAYPRNFRAECAIDLRPIETRRNTKHSDR